MHIVFFGSGGSALVARFLGEKKQKTSSLFCSLRENALPVLLGTAGIWLASPGAELFCLVMTAGCFFGFRKKYNY